MVRPLTTCLLSTLLACTALGCHSLLPSPFWPSPDFPSQERIDRLAERVPEEIPGPVEWPLEPRVAEEAFENPLKLYDAEAVEHGQTRTSRVRAHSPNVGKTFEFKWKPAKRGLTGINNSPRREIAAYQVQRLVLEPHQYVVPTTGLLCLPPSTPAGQALGEPNVDGVDCVVGAASLWLENVRYPTRRIDWQRFLSEPLYAVHAADMNAVAILIDHSDTHTRNMLVSEDRGNRRMFLIDNGISFGSVWRSPFSRDWNRIRVPALRRGSIERLRSLARSDIEFLGVLAELRPDDEGRWRPVEPGRNLAPEEPVRIRRDVVQVGLTQEELEGLWRRRGLLLELVDSGRVPTF